MSLGAVTWRKYASRERWKREKRDLRIMVDKAEKEQAEIGVRNQGREKGMEKIEKHLYRRQYQTAGGDWSVKFYAIFTGHDGKRRTFPAGDTLSDARDELGRLRTLDKGRFDFDTQKREREQAKVKAMTLNEWLDRYLGLMANTPSYETKTAQCAHIKRLLGHHPLSEVGRVQIMEYKQRRLSESLMRHGKAIEGTSIKGATANGRFLLDRCIEPGGR